MLHLAISKGFSCPSAKYFDFSHEAKLRSKQGLHSSLPQSFPLVRVSQFMVSSLKFQGILLLFSKNIKTFYIFAKDHKFEKIFDLPLLFPQIMEQEAFVCKQCNKKTSVNDGSTFHQVCGVCMETTKGPGLPKKEFEKFVDEAYPKKRKTRYVPFFGFVHE